MSNSIIKILLVEDNPGDARLIQEMLAEAQEFGLTIDWVTRLSAGIEKLGQGGVDLVLLDLGLPDSRGLETFVKAYAQAPRVPFVVLTGLQDETVALRAVRQGAQDFLVKGQTDGIMLFRAIRYATERKKVEEDLRRANEELRREIQERRAAEMAVEAERQRLYSLLDGLPGLVYLKAPDFTLKFANRLFREVCGDWEGKKCYEALFQAKQPCETCTQFGVLKTGKPSVKEATFAQQNRTYQVHSYPFADVDGSSLVLTLGIDITPRKQAEEALKESERKYRLLVSAIPAVAYKGYADWSVDFFDDKIKELTGYAKEDFNSHRLKWSDLILKEDLAEAKKVFVQALKDDGAYVREYRIRTRAGQTLWIQSRGRIVFKADGQVDHISGVFYDVSELKEATEALRQSESRLAKAQSLAHLGHWEWDLPSGEVLWSDEIYRIFGLSTESFVPTLETQMRFVHPEDEAKVRKCLDDAIAGIRPYNLVSRLVRPDGSVRYIHSQAEAIFDEMGNPQRLLGTAQDITERRIAQMRLRDSEARFRTIFEGAAIGIGLIDMEGRLLTSNKIFQKMMGYGEDGLHGEIIIEHTHEDDLSESRKLFQDLQSGRLDHYQIEKRYRRQDGQYFWARLTVSSVRGSGGQPLYAIGMVEDITQARQAEKQLKESEQRLRNLASQLMTAQEDERRRISRELHDELGQSLLVLKLQARDIETTLGPKQQRLRSECQEMLGNLDQLVDNVRRLSRDLSPMILEDLGLSAGLQRLIQDFSKHYHIEYCADESRIDDLFPPETQVAIYRIFQ
ncbi:MAG TPA: PAS domain-containing protein, partial [Desulfobaccales bacterium]